MRIQCAHDRVTLLWAGDDLLYVDVALMYLLKARVCGVSTGAGLTLLFWDFVMYRTSHGQMGIDHARQVNNFPVTTTNFYDHNALLYFHVFRVL